MDQQAPLKYSEPDMSVDLAFYAPGAVFVILFLAVGLVAVSGADGDVTLHNPVSSPLQPSTLHADSMKCQLYLEQFAWREC